MADSLVVYDGNINLEEVQCAVRSLMNNKAPGVDEISAEMLKHGKETVAEQLAELFNMIWQVESDTVNYIAPIPAPSAPLHPYPVSVINSPSP